MEPTEIALTSLKAVRILYDCARSLSNRMLMKKIEAFAAEPQSEKNKKFLNSLSPERFEELQDLLMLSLNSAESVIKAQYLRKLMNSLCEGRINWLQFGKMNFILNQIYTFDLEKIAIFYHGDKSKIDNNDKERFFTLGLLDHKKNHLWGNDTVTKKDLKELEIDYETNDLGELFVDCILFNEKTKIAKEFAEETNRNWDNYQKFLESFLKDLDKEL